jgi:hypothetical protein
MTSLTASLPSAALQRSRKGEAGFRGFYEGLGWEVSGLRVLRLHGGVGYSREFKKSMMRMKNLEEVEIGPEHR